MIIILFRNLDYIYILETKIKQILPRMGLKSFLDVLTLYAFEQTSDRFTDPKHERNTVIPLDKA